MFGCPVYTPFTSKNEINYNAINSQYQLICEKGFDCILIEGTTGEWTELTIDERIKMIEVWANICVTKKLIVNVSDICIKNVHKLIEVCKQNNIWSVVILGKQINNTDNIVNYLKEATCGFKFIYYYYPSKYGYEDIDINNMYNKLDNMIGIKIVNDKVPTINKNFLENKINFVSSDILNKDNEKWNSTFIEEFLIDYIGTSKFTIMNELFKEDRKEKGREIINEIYNINLGPSRTFKKHIDKDTISYITSFYGK